MRQNPINIGYWIPRWASLRPEKIALYSNGRSFTYRQLGNRVNRVVNLLGDLRIQKGDRVGLLLHNSHEYIEIFFALCQRAAILVPLNFRLVQSEIEFILKDSGTTALFFGSEFVELIGRVRETVSLPPKKLVCIGGTAPSWAVAYETVLAEKADSPITPPPEVDGEDPLIIMYTSGTTGVPKGATLSHRKSFYNTLNADIYYGLTHDDTLLIVRPLFHSGGLLVEALPMLYKGGTIIIERKWKPNEILKAVETYKVTVLEAPATTLRFILEQCDLNQYDLRSLRSCFTGGERVSSALIKAYNDLGLTVSQIYGQTETSTLTWLPKADAIRKMGSVGIPVFHGEVKVINKRGETIKPGEIGEIVATGQIMMSGYWGKPELTKETIKDGWLHTGDLATIDEEGFFYVVEREKDMFISGGENVYPAEIEKVYLESPKVMNVAAVGVPDDKWGEVGILFIVLKEGETMSEEEALAFCDGKLARYKMPKLIKFVSTLPMTAAEKIKRNRLREAYLQEQRDGKQRS